MSRGEPIDLRQKRFNLLPARFVWRGQAHQVARVERSRSEPERGWRPPRHYVRVRCHNGQVYKLIRTYA